MQTNNKKTIALLESFKRFFSFYRYVLPYWKEQVIYLLLYSIYLSSLLFLPYLIKTIVDKSYQTKDVKFFIVSSALSIIIFLIANVFNYVGRNILTSLKKKITFDISKDIFSHLQKIPLSFYDKSSTGELVHSINNDAKIVAEFLSEFPINFIANIIYFFVVLTILLFLNIKIAVASILLIPFLFFYFYFSGRRFKEFLKTEIKRSQNFSKFLFEEFSHIRLIKAFAKEDQEIDRFKQILSEKVIAEEKMLKLSNLFSLLNSFVNKAVAGLLTLYCGYLVIKKNMSLGSFSAIILYINQLVTISKSLGSLIENAITKTIVQVRLQNVFDITTTEENLEEKKVMLSNLKSTNLEVQNLVFGYDSHKLIFNDISFKIEANSKVALVGPSGCGKSTLLYLISKLYAPQKGKILIDGVDIKNVSSKSLLQQIGIVLQQPFLWNHTIEFNILYGNKAATEKDMFWASEIACIHQFIMNLADAYKTNIGEFGVKLSEGQKQRIAIARAIIKKPKILILDEALSALDIKTEEKIIENIKNNFTNSLVILVTHRLSAIEKMDLVYFLEASNKVDVGTHQELFSRNKKYQELFLSQLKEK